MHISTHANLSNTHAHSTPQVPCNGMRCRRVRPFKVFHPGPIERHGSRHCRRRPSPKHRHWPDCRWWVGRRMCVATQKGGQVRRGGALRYAKSYLFSFCLMLKKKMLNSTQKPLIFCLRFCVCAVSHWIHTAIVEGVDQGAWLDVRALKYPFCWFLGLYQASVEFCLFFFFFFFF
jgi:hypothetical protein